MYGVIKVGERDVPMLATAATPIRYKQVFKKNLLPYFMGKATEEDAAEMVGELAYIMAAAASAEGSMKLTEDGYLSWLEGFDPLAFVDPIVVREIINLYQGNVTSHEEVKKNQGQPNG